MNLSWHSQYQDRVKLFKETGIDTMDLAKWDILVIDHDTGIVYQGHMAEGSTYMLSDVEEFLAS